MRTIWTTLIVSLICSESSAAILVGFDQSVYTVSGANETFEVKIEVDADDSTEELESPRTGLYSFGVRADFAATNAVVTDVSLVDVAAELDFFGFDPSPNIDVGAGYFLAEGNVDQFSDPIVSYDGNLLLTVQVTNLASGPTSYPLTLDFAKDLGPTEQQFLNGAGIVLDDSIVFGRAIVQVVPEPSSCSITMLTLVIFTSSAIRRHGVCAIKK